MPALLVGVFVLQLLIHVASSIGGTAINEILWITYNKLPIPKSQVAQQAMKQQQEVLRLTKQMNGVSAQDDFARWAKLRRQHDKATAEYDKTAASLKSSRSRFDTIASAARWLGTTGLRFILQFWFAKTAIFWISAGVLPYYVEWIISFPKAPLGSVSIQCWWIACASVVKLASDGIKAARTLLAESGVKDPQGLHREQMAFAAGEGPAQQGSKHEKDL